MSIELSKTEDPINWRNSVYYGQLPVIVADYDRKTDSYGLAKVRFNVVKLFRNVNKEELQNIVHECGILITGCPITYGSVTSVTKLKIDSSSYRAFFHLEKARDPECFGDKRADMFALARSWADPCDYFGIRLMFQEFFNSTLADWLNLKIVDTVVTKRDFHTDICLGRPRYECPNCDRMGGSFLDICRHIRRRHEYFFQNYY